MSTTSGGGLVIRFAGGAHGGDLTGAVLLTPFLKYNAATMRPNSGGGAMALTRRIIGLSMLNALRIRELNGLPVLDMAFPKAVRNGPPGVTATRRYSYRLPQSFAPRSDYCADIARLPAFQLLAGTADGAFVATGFEPVMTGATKAGPYRLLDGASHLGLVHDARALALTADFIGRLGSAQPAN